MLYVKAKSTSPYAPLVPLVVGGVATAFGVSASPHFFLADHRPGRPVHAAGPGRGHHAIPLCARIHEGLVFSNRDQRTRLHALRFKIELSFKQALHTVGAWTYRFWMMPRRPIKRGHGDQFLHRQSEKYRDGVRRKLAADHRHIQIGLVAQGILQCLAALQPRLVWRHFASWLRTERSPECPSEFVVATALRHSLPDFLTAAPKDSNWRKFLCDRLDVDQVEGARLAA